MTKPGKTIAVLTAVLLVQAGCNMHRAINEPSVALGKPSGGLLKGAVELHDPAGIVEDEGYIIFL